MRLSIFVWFFLLFTNQLCAQVVSEDDPGCREKCSHAAVTQREQQVLYYQYPSMDKYDVKYLKLDINAEAASRFISGSSTTVAVAVQPLDSFIIEFRNNMILDSVYINGSKKSFSRANDFIFIPLNPVIPAGSTVTAVFYYNGTASSGAVFAGTVSSIGLNYTATLSESYQAREWFPVKQILRDKIDSADIWVTTSDVNKVGSNGILAAVVDSPFNRKQYQWKSRNPMNYYMPSIAVGNYNEYSNYAKPAAMAPDSILILNYIANNETYFASIKPNLDKTPAFIEKFSELFGLYPFKDEKYGHSQANIGGGMEHQTMTTLSSFGSTLIAHELGHQWWGDNVTCATWNHIWLNEGFASYCEYLAIEKLPALFPTTNAFAYMLGVHANVLSQPGGSVYVPEASVFDENRIFSSRLSYNKGSAIIHNLRFEMQDDTLFFRTLKIYQQQYKNNVATADDFRVVAENTCGRSFSDFFNQWYYGEGYPTFNLTYIRQGTDTLILVVNETVSSPSITPFFKGLYEFTLQSEQGDTTVKVNFASNNQAFKFAFNKTLSGISIDPNNWVLNANGTITNGGVIPVKLLSFNLTAGNNCNAVLNWKTAQEETTKQFNIEYSNNGIDFSNAAVLACNKQPGGSLYQYNTDAFPGDLFYYRLKMIDEDGSARYSEIKSVHIKCIQVFSVLVKPNPVATKLQLQVIQPKAGNTILSIVDTHGALLYSTKLILQAGTNNVKLEHIRNFSPGTYLLKAENENGSSTQKFIKL